MQQNNDLILGQVKRLNGDSIILSSNNIFSKSKTYYVDSRENVKVGDIVTIDEEGYVHSLWQPQRKDNIILATNICNERCLFCPQPQSNDIYSNIKINNALITYLHRKDINFVTITGGEPTLIGRELPKLIRELLKKNYKASIALLTNGMKFDDKNYAQEVVKSGKSNLRICIALHSDVPSIHDTITSVDGSYERTALGLLNLQSSGADIEIRIVLNKMNVNRLTNISFSIGSNFPFISHVAFMGLEVHANATENINNVWIDPPEYMDMLSKALYILKCHHIPASIYNLSYCLVPSSLWPYLRDSISNWKKTYLPICESCLMKTTCPGLFSTSLFQSPSISPIQSII